MKVEQVLMTRGIGEAIEKSVMFGLFVQEALNHFMQNDWGDTPKEDARLNDLALEKKERILASYNNPFNKKIWIVLDYYPKDYYEEAFGKINSDEKYLGVVTILFPSEY